MMSQELFSLLPLVVALCAIRLTRNLAFSLFLSALCGYGVLGVRHDFAVAVDMAGNFWQREYTAVIIFALMMGCLSALLQETGAMRVFFQTLSQAMHTRTRAQALASCFIVPGIVDEHSAGLKTSHFMRTTFAAIGVSREKLSYLCDQTSSVGPTLIGASVFFAFFASLLSTVVNHIGLDKNGLLLAFSSIAYHFYGWFSLVIMVCTALLGRDFFVMNFAERAAFSKATSRKSIVYAHNTVVYLMLFYGSVASLLGGGLLVIVTTDFKPTTNAIMAFPVGASFALFFALIFSLFNQLIKPETILAAIIDGSRSSMPLIVVMIAAWLFIDSVAALNLHRFLASTLFTGFHHALLPLVIFATSALCAMVTGAPFGVLALMVPLFLMPTFSLFDDEVFRYVAIASLMGGSIFGGQCSESSDTTVHAVMGSRCDIARHLLSKRPYVMLAAGLTLCASVMVLIKPVLLAWLFVVGIMVVALMLVIFGKLVRIPLDGARTPLPIETLGAQE